MNYYSKSFEILRKFLHKTWGNRSNVPWPFLLHLFRLLKYFEVKDCGFHKIINVLSCINLHRGWHEQQLSH